MRRIAGRAPESLQGTRLDPETTRKRREKLCARLEELAASAAEAAEAAVAPGDGAGAARSARDQHDRGREGRRPTRRQDVAREVERIAASWAHLGPPLDDDARALADRFERARDRLAERSK